MFWSSQRLEAEQQKRGNLVKPFNCERLHQGAYELALSREVLTTPDSEAKEKPGEGKCMEIPSGEFALLYTEEFITIPNDVIAFISIKAKVKLQGLVNISGFHVDPGFSGRLKFSVYNAGTSSIFLDYGEPAFLIWFSELDAETRDPYSGNHQNQDRISPEDRKQLSKPSLAPAALQSRIEKLEQTISGRVEKLEQRMKTILAVASTFATVVALPLFVSWLAQSCTQNKPSNPTPTPSQSYSPQKTTPPGPAANP